MKAPEYGEDSVQPDPMTSFIPSYKEHRRPTNRSFSAQWEAVCGRCYQLIQVGETARYAPDGTLAHHRHPAVDDGPPAVCPKCNLVPPCFCECSSP